VKLNPGDQVLVLPLNKTGVVISYMRKKVRVQVGSLQLNVEEGDLRAIGEPKPARRSQKKTPFAKKTPSQTFRRLDLHGQTVQVALTNLEDAISRSVVDGVEQLEVIHGIGTGKLREAVHNYLSKSEVIASFVTDQNNPGAVKIRFYRR